MSESSQALFATVENAVGKNSPELTTFARLLDHGKAGELEALLEDVDESDYSLLDWVEALIAFDAWLTAEGESRRPLTEMRGYIHCCTYMNAPRLCLPILKVLVVKALTEFGFAHLTEPQI